MRKVAFIFFIFVATFLLASCNSGQSSGIANEDGERLIRVGFSQADFTESDWRIANTESMRQALSRENGFDLIIVDAQNDPNKQLADVANMIEQGVDYIVIATVQEIGWEGVLQQARDAGIPVILVDRVAAVNDDLFVTWVGANFREEGETAVRWLQGFRGYDVRAVHLQGIMGSTAQIGRTGAFEDAAAENGWTIHASMTANWDTIQAKQVMENWLTRFPDINVVYAENDNMADGAIQAIEAAGLTAGGYDGITIISFDANRRYLQLALDTGKINFNVECNPLHGLRVAEIILALERGESVPRINYVDGEAFDWRYLTQEIIDARTY
ncbi:MAG: ABC transporter substrate-binding protein [Defluviitaleaceae bacterium]|nr:ABC transporter substrate-binding protein [Defluviitaleaceae bacterium]